VVAYPWVPYNGYLLSYDSHAVGTAGLWFCKRMGEREVGTARLWLPMKWALQDYGYPCSGCCRVMAIRIVGTVGLT